jgi:tetratricopeptide (TPR) repeat protein
MAIYGRGMTIDNSRLRQHWLTLGVTAWLAICPPATALASDLGPARFASQPVLAPYTEWQPPTSRPTTSLEAPVEERPSEPWQPPAETESTAELESNADSEAGVIEETAADEEPISTGVPLDDKPATGSSVSSVDESILSNDERQPLENPENDEYFAALDSDWSQGFAAEPTMTVAAAIETVPQPELPPVTPYSPTTAEITRQLLPSIQRAYGLARHGAIYAARIEFIQVLRRIAQAKDAADGCDVHSESLAAALRALDEADDFAPQGAQLEGEMDVTLVSSAHRTPVLQERATPPRPIEAIALYHEFARHQFARAVAGEQASSAALYGLGKMHNRLASGGHGDVGEERKSLVLFLAALDVAPGNHLAANEVGVLLARGGRPLEASIMFRHAIDVAPSATVYHNLAVVDRRLGYHDQSNANEVYARQLAQRDRAAGAISKANGVRWVAPHEMSRAGQPLPFEASQNQAANRRTPQPQRPAVGQVETAAKWPQKLVPGFLRR